MARASRVKVKLWACKLMSDVINSLSSILFKVCGILHWTLGSPLVQRRESKYCNFPRSDQSITCQRRTALHRTLLHEHHDCTAVLAHRGQVLSSHYHTWKEFEVKNCNFTPKVIRFLRCYGIMRTS